MELNVRRFVPASPRVVWRLMTEPDLMNRWSTAKVRLISPGEGGRADGIGAYRVVDVRGALGSTRLKEVIEDADPPNRLQYRVVDAALIRAHQGEIALEARGGETELRWRVTFEMIARPLEIAAKRMLAAELGKSLEHLASIARDVPDDVVPCPRRALDDRADPALWAEGESVLDAQRTLADRLDRAGDPKRWFTRVYAYVTENQLAWAREGNVRHVAWVLRLIPRFHHYYVSNLERRIGEAPGIAEPHWQIAFDEMEGLGRKKNDPRRMLFIGLLRGMRAHIEEDLPRALAEVWVQYYADRADFARFRADYLSMGKIFVRSSEQLMRLVPRSFLPWYSRDPIASLIPDDLKDRYRRKSYYDLPRARLLAFERAERLAAMLRSARQKEAPEQRE